VKAHYQLSTESARQLCVRDILRCPIDGTVVRLTDPTRSLDQNALMWPLLECFSEQLQWPVNGVLVKLEPDDWKVILTAAFRQETVRVAQGLDGGMVMLGCRTSKFSKKQFSDFIDFLCATAHDRNVQLDRQAA
jgi:hypothetical protein